MPVLALHHAQVFYPAGQEARARRFYVDQLGLKEIARPASLQAQAGLWFEIPGGAHVHLESLDPSIPMEVYADGERVGPLPATMEAVRDALTVRVPPA